MLIRRAIKENASPSARVTIYIRSGTFFTFTPYVTQFWHGKARYWHILAQNLFAMGYVYHFISGSTWSISTGWGSFFLFYYSGFGKKIIFMIHWFVFVLCRIFDFRKIYFWFFLKIGLEFLSRVGSIRKSIKNIYLKRIISLTIAVLLLLPKTCFFFKLYNS